MQTFTIAGALGVKHVIGVDNAVLRVDSPGQNVDIPWEAIRGIGMAVMRTRYERRTFLLIGYDAPGAPGRAVQLLVADPTSPELRDLAIVLQQRRLWRGAASLMALRASMGLSNRTSYIAMAVSLAIACVVAAIVILAAAV